MIITYNYIAFY